MIEETEAEAIRIIFDKFANSDIGLGGVAKYLNLQGIKKIPRQNGTLETWSSHFIRLILDKRELERQIDSGYYERYMLSQKPLTPAIEGSKRATGNVGDVCFNMVCLRDVRDVTADIRMWEKWEYQE